MDPPAEGDDEDTLFVRKQWIKEQMQQRIGDFTEVTAVRLFCGTYNCHAKHHLKDTAGFTDWLCPNGVAEADIYVLSFQEIIKLNAVNVTVDVKADKICKSWEETILHSLNSRTNSTGRFVHIASKQLVGVFLCVFLRERLLVHCSDIRTAVTATGIMDIMGNKGGVVIRMKLYHSTLCFVGGHLAAKQNNVAGRNSDYHSITEKTCLYPSLARRRTNQVQEAAKSRISNDRPLLLQAVDKLTPEYFRILDHDFVFWVGDLNYRIQSLLNQDEIINKCNENDMTFLRENDQLNTERIAGNVFEGFQEGQLNFLPTYKFIPGTDEYDNRPDKKLRPPAWCDRILWRVKDSGKISGKARDASAPVDDTQSASDAALPSTVGTAPVSIEDNDISVTNGLMTVAQELRSPVEVLRREAQKIDDTHSSDNGRNEQYVTQLSYTRSMTPRISDHKPVSAIFDCGVRELVRHKELEIFKELVKILDKMENAGVPKLDVKGLEIDAGSVLFKVPYVSKVRLLNIGFSAVRWKFAVKPGTQEVCPPWIRVSPRMGIIAPGEAAEINISVLFDSTAVKSIDNETVRQIAYLGLSEEIIRQLNAMTEQTFSDVLILRVRNGRDFFVSVSASYKLSGDDFAEIGIEETSLEPDIVDDTMDERISLQDASVSDADEAQSGTKPEKKVESIRAAASAAVSKLKDKAADARKGGGANRKKSSIANFNIFDA